MESKKIEVFQVLNSKGECGVQLVLDNKLLGTWQPDEARLFALQVLARAETADAESATLKHLCTVEERPVSEAFRFIAGLRRFRALLGVPQPTYEQMRALHGDAFDKRAQEMLEDFMKDAPPMDAKKSN